jgi:hypothetical protein
MTDSAPRPQPPIQPDLHPRKYEPIVPRTPENLPPLRRGVLIRGSPLAIPITLVITLIGALLARTAALRRRRFGAGRRRTALGCLTIRSPRQVFGNRVVLRGRLLALGEPVESFESGRPRAAATASVAKGWPKKHHCSASVSQRILHLALDLDQDKVAIEGPIEVVVGSSEVSLARCVQLRDPKVVDRLLAADACDTELLSGKVTLRSIKGVCPTCPTKGSPRWHGTA